MKNRRNYNQPSETSGWLKLKFTSLVRGLKKVNIGTDVWLIGRSSQLKDGRSHQVIYGPNNKEYHLYNEEVAFVNAIPSSEDYADYSKQPIEYFHYHFQINKHGNVANLNNVKIYILTHILDQKDNWCFDLKQIPSIGPLKVIYENGTVKNIDFTGEFIKEELISKRSYYSHRINDSGLKNEIQSTKFVKPIAYRIKNK